MILSSEPILPLTIVRARIIGGFVEKVSGEDEPEERLLAAAIDDPEVARVETLGHVDATLRARIERFVQSYKQDQGVGVAFTGWLDRDAALDRLRCGFRRARKRAAEVSRPMAVEPRITGRSPSSTQKPRRRRPW